jgi:hypothetical protein
VQWWSGKNLDGTWVKSGRAKGSKEAGTRRSLHSSIWKEAVMEDVLTELHGLKQGAEIKNNQVKKSTKLAKKSTRRENERRIYLVSMLACHPACAWQLNTLDRLLLLLTCCFCMPASPFRCMCSVLYTAPPSVVIWPSQFFCSVTNTRPASILGIHLHSSSLHQPWVCTCSSQLLNFTACVYRWMDLRHRG